MLVIYSELRFRFFPVFSSLHVWSSWSEYTKDDGESAHGSAGRGWTWNTYGRSSNHSSIAAAAKIWSAPARSCLYLCRSARSDLSNKLVLVWLFSTVFSTVSCRSMTRQSSTMAGNGWPVAEWVCTATIEAVVGRGLPIPSFVRPRARRSCTLRCLCCHHQRIARRSDVLWPASRHNLYRHNLSNMAAYQWHEPPKPRQSNNLYRRCCLEVCQTPCLGQCNNRSLKLRFMSFPDKDDAQF